MSDEMNKLQRQMEHATTRDVKPETRLDAETSSLQDAWLGFSQLLESSGVEIDEAKLVAHAVADQSNDEVQRSTHWGRWMLAVVGALAASVVIGVGVVWLLAPTFDVAAPQTPSSSDVDNKTDDDTVPQSDDELPRTNSMMAWDNDIDSDIVYFQQRLVSLRETQAGDRRLDTLYEKIDRLGREFEENSL